jgi:hypothetical protein
MKWWDKILVTIGFCLTIFAIGFAVDQYRRASTLSELCVNKVQKEVPSPNRLAKAIVFNRDCGAAGFPQTIVAIVPANFRGIRPHKLPDSRIGVAVWEGYCDVTIRWRDDRTVLIEESGGGGGRKFRPEV